MINGNRVIGVCLTRLENELHYTLLDAMQQEAAQHNACLMIFNSPLDFFYHNEYEQGAQAIYQLINHDLLDALVVFNECFFDKDLVRQLISAAQAKGLPVIVPYGDYPGCYTITRDYEDSFAALVAHVLEVHRPRTLRYIAGTAGMPHTELRLSVFRQVMAAHGLPVEPDMIVYCDDWNGPVIRTIDAWQAAGEIPEAIICASDTMACAACDQLELYGLRVPEDVIVTGFDGLPSLMLHTPQLTTCAQDIPGVSHMIFRMVDEALTGTHAPYDAKDRYTFVKSESCGCGTGSDLGFRARAQALFQQLDDNFLHEQNVYTYADRLLRSSDSNRIVHELRGHLLPNSMLAFNDSSSVGGVLQRYDLEQPFSSQLTAVMPGSQPLHRFPVGEMAPDLFRHAGAGSAFFFQSVYVGSIVCGYFAMQLTSIPRQAHLVRRLCRVLNLELSVLLSRMHQEHIATRMTRMQSLDSLTGLMNLRGLTAHLNDHYQELRQKHVAVSVYVIHHYQQILVDAGLEYCEKLATDTAEALRKANTGAVLIARTAPADFLVINLGESSSDISWTITDSVARFYDEVNDTNANRSGPALEVHCGCVISTPGWENNLPSFIKAATGEMYLNRLKNAARNKPNAAVVAEDSVLRFELLLEKNLFNYHFQPIVDTHTGEICGYEALMRTADPVRMNPLEVLAIASSQDRLYEIEYATLFNVMDYMDKHPDLFEGRRVYINTIPGHFLNDADREVLMSRYSHLLGSCTIEITETGDTDDAELMQIRHLEYNGSACQLAIDDYGTGFSNIVNLLRYQPQVIKIDRFLISGVDTDSNKQLFIRSTIEFARMNGIAVLAEGVETQAELSKVIELGVDLVQGYYLARPSAQVIRRLPEQTRDFIIEETLRFSGSDPQGKVYHALSGERLDMLQLAMSKYTSVELQDGNVTLVGQPRHYVNMPIVTTPGSYTQVTLENVCLRAGRPAIALGEDSSMVLTVHGSNVFADEGIYVPEGASFTLQGSGTLNITSMHRHGVALGAGPDDPFGHIRIDMTGQLSISVEDEVVLGIGGGRKGPGDPIELVGGDIRVSGHGARAIGVGCMEGDLSVSIGPRAAVHVDLNANEAIGVGALCSKANVVCDGKLIVHAEGDQLCGVGVMDNGYGWLRLRGPQTELTLHANGSAVCAGSLNGQMDVHCTSSLLALSSSGAKVCGLGGFAGGTVTMAGGTLTAALAGKETLCMGLHPVVTGGSILLSEDNAAAFAPVNPQGEALVPLVIHDRSEYMAHIVTDRSDYIYQAVLRQDMPHICVYVPEAYAKALP